MRINMSKTENDSNSYSKTWELNVYEMNRIPHEIIFDETEIAVSPKILQNELMCPICLDILKQTMTTKECLHRFCHDCIITALRAGNKECPTCRKKLISKRSLRPDPNFDGIIAKIYPNREEYDAIHEKVLEKLNKKHLTQLNGLTNSASKTRRNTITTASTSNNQTNKNDNNNNINNIETTSTSSSSSSSASSTSSTDSTLNQNQKLTHTNGSSSRLNNNELNSNDKNSINHRGVKRTANTTTNSDDSDLESRTSTEQSSLHFQNDLDEIEIILKPHPTKELLLNSKRFLKTTSNATVNHLSKYLWTRLCVEANGASNSNLESTSSTNLNENQSTNEEFQLYISSNEKVQSSFQLLGQNLSLEQVIDKYWKLNRPIELFYHQINNLKNGTTSSSASAQNENGNSNHST